MAIGVKNTSKWFVRGHSCHVESVQYSNYVKRKQDQLSWSRQEGTQADFGLYPSILNACAEATGAHEVGTCLLSEIERLV